MAKHNSNTACKQQHEHGHQVDEHEVAAKEIHEAEERGEAVAHDNTISAADQGNQNQQNADANTQKTIWPEYDAHKFAECKNISEQIRFLGSNGKWSRGQIAKFLSEKRGRKVLYQHVRNVLITPVKKA